MAQDQVNHNNFKWVISTVFSLCIEQLDLELKSETHDMSLPEFISGSNGRKPKKVQHDGFINFFFIGNP
jgi:hypothetical protein